MDIRVRKCIRVTVLKPRLGRAFSCIERIRETRVGEKPGRLLPAGRALEREREETGERKRASEREREREIDGTRAGEIEGGCGRGNIRQRR